MPEVNVREDGSLELPILVSSFGESQRLCGASERQDRSPDYPDAAEPSTLNVLVSDGTGLVKSEILKPNRGVRITHLLEDDSDELEAIRAAAVEAGTFMKVPNGAPTNLTGRQWLQVRTKGDALVYTKRYGDVEYTVVEVVGSPRNNPRDTRQKTFYVTDIIKNASGRSLHPASADSKVFTRTEILHPIARYVKENFADEAKQRRVMRETS